MHDAIRRPGLTCPWMHSIGVCQRAENRMEWGRRRVGVGKASNSNVLVDVAGVKDNLPTDYHRVHVRFHVFTKDTWTSRKGHQFLRKLDKQDILNTGFDPALRTVVVIHGFANSVTSDSMQSIKNAYFSAGGDLNLIVVDWSDLCFAPLYFAAFGNLRGVGARVAEVLDSMATQGLLNTAQLHLIGHSLGAHMAGVVGERLAAGRVPRITGLDPARPMINMVKTDGRLSPDDADLVDVIHTSAGSLGIQNTVGHVDFYPNGGKEQPGCAPDIGGKCSHGRAYEFFAETIANPGAFRDAAWLCEDEWAALHGTCEKSATLATLGEHLDFSQQGAYLLETNSESPFSTS